MANNIFTPTPGYTYGQLPANPNAAYNTWGSQGPINPYIVFGPGYTPGLYNPNTGTPLPQQPLQPIVNSGGGDDSFPDPTTPTGSGYSFGGSGSNSLFGGGVAGPSTSPGYTGPYDQGNPLATGNQGFMNELGKTINDYFSSGGIIGGIINAFSGTPTAPKTYDSVQYAQEVGVASPVKTFSSPGISQATVGTGGTISGSVTGDKGPSTVSWTGTDADGNTTGTITTDSMGQTDVTSYGGGAYSIDVGDAEEVGWEDPGTTSSSSSDSDSGSKIVCTAMNEDYGFGSYRNAIWLKYAELNYKDKPEMEVGYHAIFRPLLKIRKKWYGKPIYAWMKHVARHRSVDLRAEMYGKKRDRIGQFWRILLEPLCYFVGKRISKGDK